MITFALYVQAFCRIVIGLVFAISCFSKVFHLSAFTQTIRTFGLLPGKFSRPAALLFLSGEFAVFVFVTIGGAFLVAGFLLVILLLLIFCIALTSVLLRHIQTSCNCFGVSEKMVSTTDIWRNIGFILCAVVGWGTFAISGNAQNYLNVGEWGLAALGAALFVLVWTQLGEIIQVFCG